MLSNGNPYLIRIKKMLVSREMPIPSNVAPQETSRPSEMGSSLPPNIHGKPNPIAPPTPIPPQPIIPLPPSTVNEILKEVKEVEKHGEIPIAVGSGGVIAIPKPTSTEVKPSTEHEKLGRLDLKHVPQEEKQSSPQHLWVGWRIGPEMEKYVKEFAEAFEHGRHVGHPPIMFPMLGGVLAPIPGAPAPGAPVVISPPQGAGNQQGVAISSP